MLLLASFDFRNLATLNTVFNGAALICIVVGLIAIKRRREGLHKSLMVTAAVFSTLFLVSYVIYHLNAEPVKYQGTGVMRTVYLAVLLTHIPLAAIQVPLILYTLWLGFTDRRARHRKWAKITAPIWLYVSATGILIYFMLY